MSLGVYLKIRAYSETRLLQPMQASAASSSEREWLLSFSDSRCCRTGGMVGRSWEFLSAISSNLWWWCQVAGKIGRPIRCGASSLGGGKAQDTAIGIVSSVCLSAEDQPVFFQVKRFTAFFIPPKLQRRLQLRFCITTPSICRLTRAGIMQP